MTHNQTSLKFLHVHTKNHGKCHPTTLISITNPQIMIVILLYLNHDIMFTLKGFVNNTLRICLMINHPERRKYVHIILVLQITWMPYQMLFFMFSLNLKCKFRNPYNQTLILLTIPLQTSPFHIYPDRIYNFLFFFINNARLSSLSSSVESEYFNNSSYSHYFLERVWVRIRSAICAPLEREGGGGEVQYPISTIYIQLGLFFSVENWKSYSLLNP